MRIIAGRWRGFRLTAPAGDVARPTTDRVKESLFNLMGWAWDGGIAVDLFAGSGALGLEALSRGADRAVLVDTHPRSIAAVRDNVRRLGAEPWCEVWRMDWAQAWTRLAERSWDAGWVFVDPPYRLGLWPRVLQAIAQSPVSIRHGVVCEHPAQVALPEAVGRLERFKARAYGDIAISLYRDAGAPGGDAGRRGKLGMADERGGDEA
ncbi:16S rRNA (guanine(966)-N(2))-methyltransferase RsmD [Alicyclobacillus sp.]|uniref:16S rRNA (guanine(966)-N(2))-methyltransferase RsmD n=1 Tax=Alicyclobacillus sp. TaxID=61169 RepID=UPI0025BC3EFF|nr:16S rRNA (guanine(966)-N(2))-methyltransferase RsmD [Alicyclobacillus sp.]MCL6516437.1 16S rRNA (guanine(966)-N(2))-methyltransferase RsmD [Alicyclobacillus sp.]